MRSINLREARRLGLLGFSLVLSIAACNRDTAKTAALDPVSDPPGMNQVLIINGEALVAGETCDWNLTVNGKGLAVSRIAGSYNEETRFDGESLWRLENGAGPYRVDFAEREVWLMMIQSLLGRVDELEIPSHNRDSEIAQFKLPAGELIFEPREPGGLVAVNSPNAEALWGARIDGFDNPPKPQTIRIENIGKVAEYRIGSVERASVVDESEFSKPRRQSEGFRFHAGVGPEIEVRQADSGHLFIRPLVAGQDRGWFLFDSGAGFSGLSGEIAQIAGFERVGSTATGGIGGSAGQSDLYRGGPVRVGPLEIDSLEFVDVGDMAKATKILSEPVIGVVGWDVLIRSIVEVDLRDARILLRDPATYLLPSEYREPLFLHWQVPYVLGSFEGDSQGPFMLDTGAGNRGVVFTHFSGIRFGLLDRLDGTQIEMSGAGGTVSAIEGEIAWFEVGGHRTSPAPATFMTSEDGEADLFTVGFLGGAVVAPFRIALDYGRGEVGFIPRESVR